MNDVLDLGQIIVICTSMYALIQGVYHGYIFIMDLSV